MLECQTPINKNPTPRIIRVVLKHYRYEQL